MTTVSTTSFFLGIGLLGLLYLIWVIMSGIGLRGVTIDADIATIRQQAGLSLLSLALLSLITLAVYYFVSLPVPVPLPS